jgi:hypothetical protein
MGVQKRLKNMKELIHFRVTETHGMYEQKQGGWKEFIK